MSNKPTNEEIYRNAILKLNDKSREIDVRTIINFVNGNFDMNSFYLTLKDKIKSEEKFNEYFEKYLLGTPVEYVIGFAKFDNLLFYVDKNVLIPRVETEELIHQVVAEAKDYFKNDNKFKIFDICTGSGCIGISLCQYLDVQSLRLSDISNKAISIARINVSKHKDILPKWTTCAVKKELKGIFSLPKDRNVIITANPPYIIDKSKVDESVIKYEPYIALFTDENLSVYRDIFIDVARLANQPVLLAMEISDEIVEKILEMLKFYLFASPYKIIKDINGKNRILIVRINYGNNR